jgi:hypothetical protein
MTASKRNISSKKLSDIFCHWGHYTFELTLTDMKKLKKYLLPAICFLLILLWVYAASSKLMEFGMFRAQMSKQALFPFLKNSMPYLLPPAEFLMAGLLLFETTLRTGFYLSFVMLLAFTTYIGLGISGVFGKVPCSCGGILSHMSWNVHFVFNIFFLLLTVFGIYIVHGERRVKDQ